MLFLVEFIQNWTIMKSRYIKILILLIFTQIEPILSQTKFQRSDYRNEIYASAHFTGFRTNIYGIGYEYTVLKKKRDYYSIQNEFTKSILPKVGTDRSRLLTLFKWNRERVSVISLGLGTSFRFNSYNKFSILFNNGYKYHFRKWKTTFSGNIFLFVTPLKPNTFNAQGGSICVSNCRRWENYWRFSASIGKNF